MNELNLSSYIQIMRAGLKTHDKQESAGVFLLDAINKQKYVIDQGYLTSNLSSKKISRLVSQDDPVPDALRQASTIQNVIDNTIDYFKNEVMPDLNPHLKDDTIDKFVKLIDIDTTIPDSKKKSLMVFHEAGEDARFLAEIFLYALNRPNKKQNNTVDGIETSSPAISSTSSIPHLNKPVTIPATSVYYDEADGKIHIGNIGISIPKELAPPKDIAPEEEIYVRELLAAYADEKKTGILTLADLDSLPQKYKLKQYRTKKMKNAEECDIIKAWINR